MGLAMTEEETDSFDLTTLHRYPVGEVPVTFGFLVTKLQAAAYGVGYMHGLMARKKREPGASYVSDRLRRELFAGHERDMERVAKLRTALDSLDSFVDWLLPPPEEQGEDVRRQRDYQAMRTAAALAEPTPVPPPPPLIPAPGHEPGPPLDGAS